MIGAIIEAVALEIFLVPNGIIDGGVVGISIILAYLSGYKLGIFIFILNLPFFFIGYKQMGKTFTITSAIAVFVLSLFTVIFTPVPGLTDDPLLAAIFGGVILGIGAGLVLRNSGSSDGTEILALLLNKMSPFSVGQMVMFINVIILGAAGFVFGWDHSMYSLIAYFIAFKTIDITIEGFESSRAVWIISDEYEEIGKALNEWLGRVTYFSGEGAYTGDDKKVIFAVITRLEEATLKGIVDDIDEGAFLAIGDVSDVKGGRFKNRNIH